MQEVFARAFGPGAGYDSSRPYQPYLAAIVRNVVTDFVRVRTRERSLTRNVAPGDLDEIVGEDAPTHPIATIVDLYAIREALSALPEDQQQVFRIRYQHGLSQRAAATRAGLSYQRFRTLESAMVQSVLLLLG